MNIIFICTRPTSHREYIGTLYMYVIYKYHASCHHKYHRKIRRALFQLSQLSQLPSLPRTLATSCAKDASSTVASVAPIASGEVSRYEDSSSAPKTDEKHSTSYATSMSKKGVITLKLWSWCQSYEFWEIWPDTALAALLFLCLASSQVSSEFPAIKFRAIPRASLAAKATTSPSTADQISGLRESPRQKQKKSHKEREQHAYGKKICKSWSAGTDYISYLDVMSSVYRSLYHSLYIGYRISCDSFSYPLVCKWYTRYHKINVHPLHLHPLHLPAWAPTGYARRSQSRWSPRDHPFNMSCNVLKCV